MKENDRDRDAWVESIMRRIDNGERVEIKARLSEEQLKLFGFKKKDKPQ